VGRTALRLLTYRKTKAAPGIPGAAFAGRSAERSAVLAIPVAFAAHVALIAAFLLLLLALGIEAFPPLGLALLTVALLALLLALLLLAGLLALLRLPTLLALLIGLLFLLPAAGTRVLALVSALIVHRLSPLVPLEWRA
jgi:hypothetical protein